MSVRRIWKHEAKELLSCMLPLESKGVKYLGTRATCHEPCATRATRSSVKRLSYLFISLFVFCLVRLFVLCLYVRVCVSNHVFVCFLSGLVYVWVGV